MNTSIRLLIIEDSESDAELVMWILRKSGYEVQSKRVQTAEAMQQALTSQPWSLIICDQSMPGFGAAAALKLLQASRLDIPFIVVSGFISDVAGVDIMLAGAHDYVLKNNMGRLVPAVHRELTEAANRQANQLSNKALQESRERYHTIVEATSDAITRFDRAGHFLFGNRVALAAAGLTAAQYLGKTYAELGYSAHVCHLLANKLSQVFDTGLPEIMEITGHAKDTESIIELRLFPELDHVGKVAFVVGIARDISEKKRSEAQIWQYANFDALTNLANRRVFNYNIDLQIKHTRRTNIPFALLLIDLDKFKDINDTFGHAIGDQVLIEAARRMRLCLREVDLLARLGGDEFAVLLTDISEPNSIERVAKCLLDTLVEPFYLESEKMFISASIGISLCPTDTVKSKDLFKFSDQALFEAKRNGRGCYRHFNQELDVKAATQMRISNELHDALAQNQLIIYYQPIINLQTGDVDKAEALIRWQHPLLGQCQKLKE